jgi:hypothetical protein
MRPSKGGGQHPGWATPFGGGLARSWAGIGSGNLAREEQELLERAHHRHRFKHRVACWRYNCVECVGIISVVRK